MKGLLIVCDASRADAIAGPEGLRPLFGRPFALHALEQMVLQGVREIDVVLDTARPLDYEKAFGTGERFGTRLTFHLVRDSQRLEERLRRLSGPRLVGLAHRVVNAAAIVPASPVQGPLVWCGPAARTAGWSGWAVLPDGLLATLPSETNLESLGRFLIERGEKEGLLAAVQPVLAADDVSSLLKSQETAFDCAFLQKRGLPLPGGVTLGRAVDIDPSARITGPVFIGDQATIEAGAIVGPFAVVGAGAIVGRETVLRHAIVGRRTLVGERLDIEGALATSRGLVHAARNAEVAVTDPIILSSLQRSALDLRAVSQWGAALALFAAGLPLMTIGWLMPRRKPAAGRPAGSAPRPSLRDLAQRVLPRLPFVVAGRLPLIGREDVALEAEIGLPHGWRERLLSIRPGLLSAALVDADSAPLVRHLSDLTFAARPSLRADAGLLFRYLRAVAASVLDWPRERFRRPAAWAIAAPARIRN